MADKSFGNFGTYKYKYYEERKNKPSDSSIDLSNLSHSVLKDVEYFRRNLNQSDSSQVVNYTWEKPSNESPNIYTKLEGLKDDNSPNKSTYQNTLDMMAVYKGIPHCVKQNKWEMDPSEPPKFLSYPQRRHTANQSAMTQYVEEMNKAFPGESMY